MTLTNHCVDVLNIISYACSDSLLLTPLCCDDIPEVTPCVSALAGCDTIPTPPITIESSTITTAIPKSDALFAVQLRVAKLEKDVSELKKMDLSDEALATLKSQVPNVVDEYLGSKLGDALQKTLQKHSTDLIQKHSVKPASESSK
ncbi:hypothetical protein Tco_0830441, partial [Tanacetum coccineum]